MNSRDHWVYSREITQFQYYNLYILYLGLSRYSCSHNQMESSVGLTMIILLIILPVQCNARVGPYNYMQHVKHGFDRNEGKVLHIGDHRQVISSNQNAGAGHAGVVPSKSIVLSFDLLGKASPIPPSGPSPGHN